MEQKRRIKIGIIVGFFLILAFYSGFRAKHQSPSPNARIAVDGGYREVMGTLARIVAVALDEATAATCIKTGFEQLEMVDNSMSDYKSDSQISRVNRYGSQRAVKVGKPTFEVLQKSVEFSKLTDGAFDVTIGPLVDLWRSAGKANSVPSDKDVAAARAKAGYQKLILDANEMSVRFAAEGMRIDLGGIAKGYAIDKAVEAMQEAGAVGGMVDVGGDIRCFGAPPPGKNKWLIGVQNPRKTENLVAGEPLLVLKLTNAAVATSGDYRRFILIENRKYSHIINTRSGRGTKGLASVTIISPSAIHADALATAVSVIGAEKGLALIEKLPQTEAILILSEPKHELLETSGAQKYLE